MLCGLDRHRVGAMSASVNRPLRIRPARPQGKVTVGPISSLQIRPTRHQPGGRPAERDCIRVATPATNQSALRMGAAASHVHATDSTNSRLLRAGRRTALRCQRAAIPVGVTALRNDLRPTMTELSFGRTRSRSRPTPPTGLCSTRSRSRRCRSRWSKPEPELLRWARRGCCGSARDQYRPG